MSRARAFRLIALTVLLSALAACGGKRPPATAPGTPGPSPFPGAGTRTETPVPPRPPDPPPPAETVPPLVTVAPPVSVDPLTSMQIDDVNRSSPLKPVFFQLDSDQLDDTARQTLNENST